MIKLFGRGWILVAVALLVVPASAWAEKNPVGRIIAIIGSAEYLPGEGELVAEAQPGQSQVQGQFRVCHANGPGTHQEETGSAQ